MSGISKLEGIGAPRPPGRKLLPVPRKDGRTPGQEAGDADGGRPAGRQATLRPASSMGTPSTPFLAQLSLQYDDISAARADRRERQTAAAGAYAADPSAQQARISGGRQANLRV